MTKCVFVPMYEKSNFQPNKKLASFHTLDKTNQSPKKKLPACMKFSVTMYFLKIFTDITSKNYIN